MKTCILPALLATVAAPAAAADVKPIIDARLRYEHVDQEGLPEQADAVTLRARAGLEAHTGDFAVLAEAEGTLALDSHYNDGLNNKARFPLVGDPENVELNRLQLQYRGLPKTIITAGRQRIALDDQRFVGDLIWRQNQQTFDAARIEWAGIPKLKVDVSYAWAVRTIWGIDGYGARPSAIDGDNVFATLSYATPIGTVEGFSYLVDQDEAAVQGFRLSSQTYGVRLAGARPLGKGVKLSYAGSYARQSDWHRNPNNYAADYWLADAALDVRSLKLGAGYEVLGADKGVALTSFQTPDALLHKFQGWADKFLTTPPNGIKDLYGSAGYGWTKVAGLDAIGLQAIYHRFDSARADQHYGDEVDLLASAKFGRFLLLGKYADYRARQFATDTRKFWLQLEWSY